MKFLAPLFVCVVLTGMGCLEERKESNELFWDFLKRPTLGLFGDSVSAIWPEELLEPFIVAKVAFAIRSTEEIYQAALSDERRFSSCLYNGGINDFLSDYFPESKKVQKAVANQEKTLRLLMNKCDRVLALNVWYVEPPWPVLASIEINLLMKEKINFVPRFDPELCINSGDLLDGGHLTYQGFQKLSGRVLAILGAGSVRTDQTIYCE